VQLPLNLDEQRVRPWHGLGKRLQAGKAARAQQTHRLAPFEQQRNRQPPPPLGKRLFEQFALDFAFELVAEAEAALLPF
jgi:hypothetical protein